MSVRAHQRLRAVLPDRIALEGAGGLVEAERAVKEPGEVEKIAAAAALADEVYDWLREHGIVGRSEREVAFELEHEMRRRGATDPSFPSIVASGPRGALPHATPTGETIERGTLVTLRHGRRARRLLLGLHAHVGDRRAPRRPRRDLRADAAARRSPRSTPSGPGRRGARSTPWRAT